MFQKLRRQDLKMEDGAVRELLLKADYGILSTVGAGGCPYGVPVSYVYDEKKQAVYIHCARQGHKLENILFNPKASFCVVGEAQTLPDRFSVRYQSVIAFGQVLEVDDEEKHEALAAFLLKYSPDYPEKGHRYMKADEPNCRVLKMTIEHLSGKKRSS